MGNYQTSNLQLIKHQRGKKYDYSLVKYVNSTTKIEIICKKHGIFFQTIANHMGGNSCPMCRESRMEFEIRKFLEEFKIAYKQEKTFPDCINIKRLPFDFYLEEKNICIEADGIQHFEPVEFFGGTKGFERTKKMDGIKNNYCNENGIKLIRISYLDFDKINEILRREVIA
jgi:very-short-patch-repair endonuclease